MRSSRLGLFGSFVISQSQCVFAQEPDSVEENWGQWLPVAGLGLMGCCLILSYCLERYGPRYHDEYTIFDNSDWQNQLEEDLENQVPIPSYEPPKLG